MNFKKGIKLFANLTLLVSFVLTYFLDLTGLELHQYLGVAAAAILVIHIITHWNWIVQVSARAFSQVSGRVRLYYLLDSLLLIAFVLIMLTGVLISTWLNIFLNNYLLLRLLHIIASIAGLLLLIVKMGLHWKYFVKVLNPIRIPIRKMPLSDPTGAAANKAPVYSRRAALKTIGVISAVGLFGVFKASSAFIIPKAGQLPDLDPDPLPDPDVESIAAAPTAQPEPTPEPIPQLQQNEGGQKRRRGGSSSGENLAQAVPQQQQPTLESTEGEQPHEDQPADNQLDNSLPVENCVVRCDKGCAFPGLCRRYTDQNQNQLCDLGECWPV